MENKEVTEKIEKKAKEVKKEVKENVDKVIAKPEDEKLKYVKIFSLVFLFYWVIALASGVIALFKNFGFATILRVVVDVLFVLMIVYFAKEDLHKNKLAGFSFLIICLVEIIFGGLVGKICNALFLVFDGIYLADCYK